MCRWYRRLFVLAGLGVALYVIFFADRGRVTAGLPARTI